MHQPEPEDTALLREMLREAERDIDTQVRQMAEQDDKTEQTLTLGIATLGGGLALATLIGSGSSSDVVVLAGLLMGGACNILGLARLLEAYLGSKATRWVHVGPSLAWMAQKANDADWTVKDHLLSLLADYPDYHTATTTTSCTPSHGSACVA